MTLAAPARPCAARARAVLPRLGPGGRPADAHEQPRPRGRRAPRRPGGLRRHRARRRALGGFDAIVRELRALDDDETLLVQSGKPVGVFRTHEWAPRVLIANSNLVGRWATWEHFRELERPGLMMYGQMTAGSWIYIGTQGILQGTYETFAELRAASTSAGTLRGRLVLTAGLGGMGGAQPLAVTMNERRLPRHRGRPERASSGGCDIGYLDRAHRSTSTRRSPGPARQRAAARRCRSACVGNAAEVMPELVRRGERARRGHRPDLRPRRARRLRARRACRSPRPLDAPRATTPTHYVRALDGARWRATSGRCSRCRRAGAVAFDYGNNLRAQAHEAGVDRRLRLSRASCRRTSGPLFCEGKGPFRWVALSGDPEDIRAHRPRPSWTCSRTTPALARWIRLAQRAGAVPGAAGAHLLAGLRRAGPGGAALQRAGAPRRGEGAHRHRPRPPRRGSVASPNRETEAMRTAPTPSPTGRCSTRWSTPPPARAGSASTTAAAWASATASTPAWWSSPTARDPRPEAGAGADHRPGDGRRAPRRRRLRAGHRGRPGARRPHPDARRARRTGGGPAPVVRVVDRPRAARRPRSRGPGARPPPLRPRPSRAPWRARHLAQVAHRRQQNRHEREHAQDGTHPERLVQPRVVARTPPMCIGRMG